MGLGVAALGLWVAACGRSRASPSHATSAAVATRAGSDSGASGTPFTQARLSSLDNYTFTTAFPDGLSSSGEVESPTDWKTTGLENGRALETTYDVGGHGYAVVNGLPGVQTKSYLTPEGIDSLEGEAYFAKTLLLDAREAGVRVVAAGSCLVAGHAGTTYELRSAANAASVLAEAERACVARSTGALLSFGTAVAGGSAAAAAGVVGAGGSFTVTSIGGVGPIIAPSAASSAATGP